MSADEDSRSAYDKIVFKLKNNRAIAIVLLLVATIVFVPKLMSALSIISESIFADRQLSKVDFHKTVFARENLFALRSKVEEELAQSEPNLELLRSYFYRYIEFSQERCVLTYQNLELAESSAKKDNLGSEYPQRLYLIKKDMYRGCSKQVVYANTLTQMEEIKDKMGMFESIHWYQQLILTSFFSKWNSASTVSEREELISDLYEHYDAKS